MNEVVCNEETSCHECDRDGYAKCGLEPGHAGDHVPSVDIELRELRATLAARDTELASLKARLVDAPDVAEIRARAAKATPADLRETGDLIGRDIPRLCDALAKRDAELAESKEQVRLGIDAFYETDAKLQAKKEECARMRLALTAAAGSLADSAQSWFWANERQEAIDAINRALADMPTPPENEPAR